MDFFIYLPIFPLNSYNQRNSKYMQNEILGKIWGVLQPPLLWLLEFGKTAWGKIGIFSANFFNQTIEKYPALFIPLQKNKLSSALIAFGIFLILIFWLKAIVYVAKDETEKKLWLCIWLSIVFILGPIGAIIYYFGKKRTSEKREYEKQRIELSFFTPMSKRPPK
jgi:hypothetical protein